jgi:magnesium transporter
MLTIYEAVEAGLARREPASGFGPATVWVDLLNPTREEDRIVEQALGISVPTREEMAEIEVSSRLYQEGGAYCMTAIVLHQRENETPVSTPITFILAGQRLVTVRYVEPRAFSVFLVRAQKKDINCSSGAAVLVGLLESIIDREADRVERIQGEVDILAQTIFSDDGDGNRAKRFDINIRTIGREGEMTSRSRECLLTLGRLLTYLSHVMVERGDDKALRARVKTAARDIQSLTDHVGYLSSKITFLLDATLGMINNEQNTIIKIFSVLAVVLLPPTLIGTVYGMNFKHMPELEWTWGYPWALGLMFIAAVLPWLYFKRKGWL